MNTWLDVDVGLPIARGARLQKQKSMPKMEARLTEECAMVALQSRSVTYTIKEEPAVIPKHHEPYISLLVFICALLITVCTSTTSEHDDADGEKRQLGHCERTFVVSTSCEHYWNHWKEESKRDH